MALEVERKFLSTKSKASTYIYNCFAPIKKYEIEQSYIKIGDPEERIRMRKDLETGKVEYFHTIKKGQGLVREEIENLITKEEYDSLKEKVCCSIKKERVVVNGIEFDFYEDGLVTFEIEFESEEQANKFQKSEDIEYVIIEEITGNKEYSNVALAQRAS